MKCLVCGKDLFPGQFSCQHCGTIVAIAEKKKAKEEKKEKKEKK